MGQLTIKFGGVCAHFYQDTAGVPHRVVLPDASNFHHGRITIDGRGEHEYFLMPHYAQLRVLDTSEQAIMTAEGAIHHGWIYAPCRVEVANAQPDQGIKHTNFDNLPKLTWFVQAYQMSQKVVDGWGARCHLDFKYGLFTAAKDGDQAVSVVVTLNTDGPPRLAVQLPDGTTQTIQFETDLVRLGAGNTGELCDSDTAAYDFLLNYLTAEGGIPRRLIRPTPGMNHGPETAGPEAAGLIQLWCDLSAACSNTGYP